MSGAWDIYSTEVLEQRQIRFMELDVDSNVSVSTTVFRHDFTRQQCLKKRAPLPISRTDEKWIRGYLHPYKNVVGLLDDPDCHRLVNVTSEMPERAPILIYLGFVLRTGPKPPPQQD